MSRAENKDLIVEYFHRVTAGGGDPLDLIADSAQWWVPPSSPLGGLHEGKPAIQRLVSRGRDLYDPTSPFKIEILSMVAEGDAVCVQTVMEARTRSGEEYRNHYHFAFCVSENQIVEVKEYVDTLYVQRKRFDGLEGSSS